MPLSCTPSACSETRCDRGEELSVNAATLQTRLRGAETGCATPSGTSKIRDRIRMTFRSTEVPVCCLVLYSAFSHGSPFRLKDSLLMKVGAYSVTGNEQELESKRRF